MPVYIGDVLESAGGPVLDLSTRQVKGLGFFSDTDQRDELDEDIRVNGHVASIDSVLSVYRNDPTADIPSPWENVNTWFPIPINKGFAFNVVPGSTDGTEPSVGGFTIGNPYNASGENAILKAGDIFHIKNPYYTLISATLGNETVAHKDSNGYPWKSQSFLVVNDTTIPVNINGYINSIGDTLDSIEDRMDSGDIISLFENRTMIGGHRTAEDVFGEGNVASGILSENANEGASMLLGGFVNGKLSDYRVSIQEFISILGVGIAENYVEEGYGDYVSYGGNPGQTWSAGDINGDGIVSVADLIILLGSFGNTVDPSFSTTTANIIGSRGLSSSLLELNSDQYIQTDTSMSYMFKDWGSSGGVAGQYGPQPTFVTGGAAVTYINATNSFTELDSPSSPPGDIIKFSDDENVDFYLNYFANSGSDAVQIQLEEPNIPVNVFPDGGQIGLDTGYRNRINLTSEQIEAISSFLVVARIRRYSSNQNIGSASEDLIDDNELILSNNPISDWSLSSNEGGATFFFNLINPSTASQGVSTLNITTEFSSQVGAPLFLNVGSENVKAVGVQIGYRFLGDFQNTSMTHADAKFGYFSLKCIPQV